MPDRAIGSEQEYGIWDHERGCSFQLNNSNGQFLENGCRFYVDCGHPEYASPETRSVRDAVIYDKAGEIVVRRKVGSRKRLFKNNKDFKGASYGSHENYCVLRNGDLNDLIDFTLPFLVSRIIFTGSGTLVSRGERTDFEVSQKSGFTRDVYSPASTYYKPIYSTRDEPHASERYRRLHVVCGDANMSEVALFLKFGTAKLMLDLYEQGVRLPFSLQSPLEAMHSISSDLKLKARYQYYSGGVSYTKVLGIFRERANRIAAEVRSKFQNDVDRIKSQIAGLDDNPHNEQLINELNRQIRSIERQIQERIAEEEREIRYQMKREFNATRKISAIQIQRHYHRLAESAFRGRDNETDEVLDRWNHVLTGLEGDLKKQADLDRWLDWRIKRCLMRRYEERGLLLRDPKMRDIDIQYHELGEKGLFGILQEEGFVDRMVSDSEIANAAVRPPEDTRAKIRGMAARALNAKVFDWDKIAICDRYNRVKDPSNCGNCIRAGGHSYDLDEPLHTYPELQRKLGL